MSNLVSHRILSFWGGGVRGAGEAAVLARVEEMLPWFRSRVSHAAGASTGALVACGVAAGMSGRAISDLYLKRARDIFEDSAFDDIKDAGKLLGADYGSDGIRRVLAAAFGDLTLGDLGKTVTIPTLAMDRVVKGVRTRAPKFWSNWPGDKDRGALVRNVLWATTAAPTYFPLACLALDGRPTLMVDGGLVRNNPCLSAVVDAHRHGVPVEDISVLSIGSGIFPSSDRATVREGEPFDAGLLWWGKRLLPSFTDPSAMASSVECEWLLEEGSFFEFNFVLPREVPLDSAEAVPEVIEVARSADIGPLVEWLERIWR